MTDETPAPVEITPRMQDIIEHMLENPRGKFYAKGVSEATGVSDAQVGKHLRAMFDANWLTDEIVPYTPGRKPRRYYRFTAGTAPMLRKALRA